MFSKTVSCVRQDTGFTAVENNNLVENPFDNNFEIIRCKPLKDRLLDNHKYPMFKHKCFGDIEKTLRESCNFEQINEVMCYLERNPHIYDVVPGILDFISSELKKEDQQRTPILLRALYCLYINSVTTISDFSVCTNALEHFLTKSSTFPGDYVLKDIAADILSDICAMSPSDDLKEHVILQLSRVFHNPNWHSYNLYGGIVGCLSNLSVKSDPEVVPYDEFNSDTFLRHVLSSPRMLKKLFYLCKPFIYSHLPSRLIPTPLRNEKSFYDINTNLATVFNLMRNEMVIPVSYVKYDHKFSKHYQFEGGWFDDAKWSDLPADCPAKDLIWPGYSDYKREKLLEKNIDLEKDSQIEAKSEDNTTQSGTNSESGSTSSSSIDSNPIDHKSDGYLYSTHRKDSTHSGYKSDCQNLKSKYFDCNRSDYTKMWLIEHRDDAKLGESNTTPLIDRECSGHLDSDKKESSSGHRFKSGGFVKKYKKRKYSDSDRKSDCTKRWLDKYGDHGKDEKELSNQQKIQSDFSEGDTDGSKNEYNFQAENETKPCISNEREYIQSDFSASNTDGNNYGKSFQIKNEKELHHINLKQLQVTLKKIEWNFDDGSGDITDHGTNPQADSKDADNISSCEKKKLSESDSIEKTCTSEKILQIASYSGRDSDKDNKDSELNLRKNHAESNSKTDITDYVRNLLDKNKSSEAKNNESDRKLRMDCESNRSTDIADCEKNLQYDNKSNEGVYKSIIESKTDITDYEENLQIESESTKTESSSGFSPRNISAQADSEFTDDMSVSRSDRNDDTAAKDKKRVKTKRPESPGFRTHEEYSDFLAWKREKSYGVSYSYNKIGETLQLIPPNAFIDPSMFEHTPAHFDHDTHIISSEYISEESMTVGQYCCERSNTCTVPPLPAFSQPDLEIFKNVDKKIFANWEFKKPKGAKKDSPVAERSESRGLPQKKCKTRGGRKR